LIASTFIVLALTGLNLVLGRTLLLPLIGERAFGTLSTWGKIAHNYLSWPFMFALVLVFALWVLQNIPGRLDWIWIKQGGGFLKKRRAYPGAQVQRRAEADVLVGDHRRRGDVLHRDHAALPRRDRHHRRVAVLPDRPCHRRGGPGRRSSSAHIYIGTLGMEGAFEAMGSGEVDENWAKEHHSLWVDEK
jgi:formate dehydrogenase subunit gamma